VQGPSRNDDRFPNGLTVGTASTTSTTGIVFLSNTYPTPLSTYEEYTITATSSGASPNISITFNFTRVGRMVTASWNSSGTYFTAGIDDSLTFTGIVPPAFMPLEVLQDPSAVFNSAMYVMTDADVETPGYMQITSDRTIAFGPDRYPTYVFTSGGITYIYGGAVTYNTNGTQQ
jgi:hypothetical protein